jgi:malonyl-CoA O-methyltransferase
MSDPKRPGDPHSAYALDAAWLRRGFDRAGTTYDAAAVLESEVRDRLLERLDLTALAPDVVLDAGAGTGLTSRALKRRYPKARVLAVDSSLGMLRTAARRRSWLRPFSRVCADAAALPLKDASVDLIVSNFLLPWIDPERVLKEFRRVLAPHGLLSFTSLGPDTLKELRAAWAQVDAHTRVLQFIDMHDLGDALMRLGFAAPVLDVERYTLYYTEVRRLAADLKALGARNATAGRLKGLTGPRKFAAMAQAYEAFRRDGRLPATHEVVFGQAWGAAEASAPHLDRGGSRTIPLDDMRRQLRGRGRS